MESHTVVRENWLTRKLNSSAAPRAALVTLTLVLGSLVYWANFAGAQAWMSASRAEVFEHHDFWRCWTTLLVHADAKHLLSNCFLFFIMGSFLIGYFGLFVFPVLGFLMGGLTNLLVLNQMPPTVTLIGVSGVVFWMGGFWLVLYFFLESRKSLWQRALRATGVGLALFMPAEAFDPSISYQSHLLGFISGALSGLIYYFIRRRQFLVAEVVETIFEVNE